MRIVVFTVIAVIFFTSCAKEPEKKDIAFKVNNYEISASEFNEIFRNWESPGAGGRTRGEFAKMWVDRMLLLQEAQRKGIHKKSRFIDALEKFWAQTLIEMIVEEKSKSITDGIFISNKEKFEAAEEWERENPGSGKSPREIEKIVGMDLMRKELDKQYDIWIDSLRSKAEVEIDEEALGIKK